MSTNTSNPPTILVKPGESDRIIAGHPWVYGGSIIRAVTPAEDGALVQVKDHRHRFLGVGVFNSKSKINIRMLAPTRVVLDSAFFETRIRAALEVRKRHMPSATSFRVVNAESDFLSGVIVDKYEDILVLQISSLGMDMRKSEIISALGRIFSPRAIIERSDMASRKFEGMTESQGLLAGTLPEGGKHKARMNGLDFEVDMAIGHKTGLYLDQQQNYARVAEWAAMMPGARALDCFSFAGGFGLHLARAGAASVKGVDQSQEANAAAARNAAANGLDGSCAFESANVFDWLKSQTSPKADDRSIGQFDIIVLDPPSFTRNRAAVEDALRGYKEIHLRALKLLKPGGVLATFCCSHHVDANLFQDAILSAAYDAHKVLRRVATYSQSPDHPVLPIIPETEYLKGFAFEVAR